MKKVNGHNLLLLLMMVYCVYSFCFLILFFKENNLFLLIDLFMIILAVAFE
jgi:hypothetical protein